MVPDCLEFCVIAVCWRPEDGLRMAVSKEHFEIKQTLYRIRWHKIMRSVAFTTVFAYLLQWCEGVRIVHPRMSQENSGEVVCTYADLGEEV